MKTKTNNTKKALLGLAFSFMFSIALIQGISEKQAASNMDLSKQQVSLYYGTIGAGSEGASYLSYSSGTSAIAMGLIPGGQFGAAFFGL